MGHAVYGYGRHVPGGMIGRPGVLRKDTPLGAWPH